MNTQTSHSKYILLIFVFISSLSVSCKNVLDKPLNRKDFLKIEEKIMADQSLKEMKKKYIIDNLSLILGFSDLVESKSGKVFKENTFRELIEELNSDYDSIESQIKTNIDNNRKIRDLVTLQDAEVFPINEYKGYLALNLELNNSFNKEILYIILNYKYINKYDSKFFEKDIKLTDEVAGDFNGLLEATTTENYNDVAEFMYRKVPVQAPLKLRNELGKEAANKKVQRDFLMEGLIIETKSIIFKDKSELKIENEDWEYLETKN